MSRLARELALREGFDVAGVCDVSAPWLAERHLQEFLDAGYHGEMDWMETTRARRGHPRSLWPEARSAVAVGMNYGPPEDPLRSLGFRDRGYISVYARNRDYHGVLKGRLRSLAGSFARASGAGVKIFVDTAPLMEKPIAHLSGLGWPGKHTNLVSRRFGSWLFLGVMLTDVELDSDAAMSDHCGSCRACLEVCPTDAFPAPYRLDARRCISYLTIEHKGPIPFEFREAMGNRVYGCDDCLAVCPWNRFAHRASAACFQHRAELTDPPLAALAELDDTAFRAWFAASPVKRIGRDRFVRNVLIAIGNSGEGGLARICEERLTDASAVVRGAAVWALGRLDPMRAEAMRLEALAIEDDETVRSEWQRQI